MLPVTVANGKPVRGSKGSQTTRQARYKALVVVTVVLGVVMLLVDSNRQRHEPASHAASHAARHDAGVHRSERPLSHLKNLVLVACHSVYTVCTRYASKVVHPQARASGPLTPSLSLARSFPRG